MSFVRLEPTCTDLQRYHASGCSRRFSAKNYRDVLTSWNEDQLTSNSVEGKVVIVECQITHVDSVKGFSHIHPKLIVLVPYMIPSTGHAVRGVKRTI